MNWTLVILFGFCGLVAGRVLNLAADRISVGYAGAATTQRCTSCGLRSRNLALLPVFGPLVQERSCSSGQTHRRRRAVAVESAMAVGYSAIGTYYGITFEGIVALGYVSILTVLAIVDIEQLILPNKIVFPGAALTLAAASFLPGIGPVAAVEGAAVGFVGLLLIYLLVPNGIGAGDVKLGLLVGAIPGFPMVFLGIGLAFFSGGIAAGMLLLTGRVRRGQRLPFGPFLCAGAVVTLFWGHGIAQWYLHIVTSIW